MSTLVGLYRDVLKASSVRGMLQRKARLVVDAPSVSGREGEHERWVSLHRWADDGGSVRCER